jgi:transcriptional regulator with XRE-family HTH domain
MSPSEVLHNFYTKEKISQPELAEKLSVSQGTVHYWLSGKRQIPLEYYGIIAELCEVPLLELLPGHWKKLLNQS